MNILKQPEIAHSRQAFQKWYRTTTSGKILQSIEASYLQNSLQLTYKQTILQVGELGSEEVYIPDDFKKQWVLLSRNSDSREARGVAAVGDPSELPFGAATIDLLILAHVIEFEQDPHQVLREVERVLKPEGQLFVISFNPLSLRGLTQYWPRRRSFWHFNLISCYRLLDWMHLLKFDAKYHAAFCSATAEVIHIPTGPLQYSRAFFSMAYAVKAIKRTYTVIPIEGRWLPAQRVLAGQIAETSLTHDEGTPT